MNLAELNTSQKAQYEGCLEALRLFREGVAIHPQRLQGQLTERLHFFLQQITILTAETPRLASSGSAQLFLNQTLGLYEHDLRRQALDLLGHVLGNPNLIQPPQPGPIENRKLFEWLSWGHFFREAYRRTRVFFESITEEQILEQESKCTPFYLALAADQPTSHEAGVFLESDLEVVQALQSLGASSERPKILDIGCGEGRLLQCLAQSYPGAILTGTSIFSFTQEFKTQMSAKGISLIHCPAQKIALADSSQDIVVSTEVIEHLRHPEAMIREIARVLKPGGIFCVTAPLAQAQYFNRNPFSYLAVAIGTIFPSILPRFHHLYAPMTPLRIVHYGFERKSFKRLFQKYFPTARCETTRFTSLKKFGLERAAKNKPILKHMGGLALVTGAKLGA